MQHHRGTHHFRLALNLGLLGLFVLAALNYQAILDQYALATFSPSANISSIESRISLTTKARAIFYRSKPQVDQKAGFNKDCDTQPHELELGCYYHGRIFILNIDNKSLVSEMDVVAAHELLHAVWARMPLKEREKLGAELRRVYSQLDNKDLRQRMAGYAKSEPGEETNELHSILATEFASLSPALEEHYSKYFEKRAVIVTAHASYQSVFDTRRAELEKELAEIRSQKAQLGIINGQLDAYRARGQISAYNALVPRQNRLVDDINKRIADYQAAVDEYNALSKSLDSQQIVETELPAQ